MDRRGRPGLSSHDAWVLARLVCGLDVDAGRLGAMDDRGRWMADRLAEAAPADRLGAWELMIGASPEKDDLLWALASVDPLGPPPEEDADPDADGGGSRGGWGLLRVGEEPTALPFPCAAFVPEDEAFCRLTAQALLAAADYVGLSMLVTAGTAIGQSVNVEVKPGWTEAPLLYAVLVGEPGRVKTPAMRAATAPLTEIDERLWGESERAQAAWRDEEGGRAPGAEGPPRRPEPPSLRAIVQDITRESLCAVLADNPRGVLCAPDEATAWVNSWDQYRAKGTDEQFWLSIYSGEPVRVDRKGDRRSLRVPHPFCAVLGSIQPGLLASLRDDRGRDNGFLDRIVFSYPQAFPPRAWTDAVVPEPCAAGWAAAIRRLHDVPMRELDDGRRAPWVARLTPEAQRRFIAWFDENARAMDAIEARPGALSKAEARLARLALILSRLRLARDPKAVLLDPDGLGVPPVELRDVEGAIRLDAYFASHLERALHEMNRGALRDPDARALMEWIRRGRRASFRESEVRKDLKRFYNAPDLLVRTLESLVALGLIRPKPQDDPWTGRKPTPAYDVHPDFLARRGPLDATDAA